MRERLIENGKRGRSGQRHFPAAYRSTTLRGLGYVTSDAWNVAVVVRSRAVSSSSTWSWSWSSRTPSRRCLGAVRAVFVVSRASRRVGTGAGAGAHACACVHVRVRNWRHSSSSDSLVTSDTRPRLPQLRAHQAPERRENDVPLHLRARPVNRCTRSMQVNELSALPMLSLAGGVARSFPFEIFVPRNRKTDANTNLLIANCSTNEFLQTVSLSFWIAGTMAWEITDFLWGHNGTIFLRSQIASRGN